MGFARAARARATGETVPRHVGDRPIGVGGPIDRRHRRRIGPEQNSEPETATRPDDAGRVDRAGVPGLEPRLTEPESVVLPITPYPKGYRFPVAVDGRPRATHRSPGATREGTLSGHDDGPQIGGRRAALSPMFSRHRRRTHPARRAGCVAGADWSVGRGCPWTRTGAQRPAARRSPYGSDRTPPWP